MQFAEWASVNNWSNMASLFCSPVHSVPPSRHWSPSIGHCRCCWCCAQFHRGRTPRRPDKPRKCRSVCWSRNCALPPSCCPDQRTKCEAGARRARPAHLSETCRRTGSSALNWSRGGYWERKQDREKSTCRILLWCGVDLFPAGGIKKIIKYKI